MLLRNYDNIKALANTCFISGITRYYATSSMFGDGHLSLKNTSGAMNSNNTFAYFVEPLHSFFNGGNGNTITGGSLGDGVLICGYEENEVTYDDYKIDNLASGLKFVENTLSLPQLNENNELVSTYTKILCNTSSADITINCIGVTYYASNSGVGYLLVYKEKIPEITIAPKQNVVLTFTTKVPMGQNKPADYSVSASA